VLARPKGLQAFRVVSMDESTAIHPAQMPPPRTHVTVTPTSGLERAQVKWFNRLRGFGFLTRGEGTPDIFVHMETLRRFGMTELRPGQFLLVRFGPGPKGLMAAEVHPEGGPLGLASTSGGPYRWSYADRVLWPAAALLAAVAVVAVIAAAPAQAAGEATIEIISKSGVHAFAVELATNEDERSRGLMFRKQLPDGHGMLFDFEQDRPVAFWMHNTYISLDMIFITGDGHILRIAESTEPLSDRLIPSGGPVRAVLEVIAGTARKVGIAPGDRVTGSIFGGRR
jgi:uncharacterized membrane protein (UPF0127 family)/cold shock CspA family protein